MEKPTAVTLLGLTGKLYDAVSNPQEWHDFLDNFARIFRAHGSAQSQFRPSDKNYRLSIFHGYDENPARKLEMLRRFDEIAHTDTRLAGYASHPGQALTCREAVDQTESHRSQAYIEVLQPMNIEHSLCVFLQRDDGTMTIHGLMRRVEDGEFTSADKEMLQAIVPHAYHALNFQWLLGHRDQGAEEPADAMAAPFADLANDFRSRMQGYPQNAHAGGGIRLSPRERDVLSECAAGLRSKEIAQVLGISVRTVEHHFAKAIQRLNAKSRAEAVAIAIATNLIDF